MIKGRSNQRGILFSDSGIPGENAVYCWRDGDAVNTLVGPSDELSKLFVEESKAGKSADIDRRQNRAMAAIAAFAVLLVVAAVVFDGRPHAVAAAVVFVLAGAFPLLALSFTLMRRYARDEDFAQMRRNHGAEHAVLAYYRALDERASFADEPISLDDLRRCSHVDPECGTVYLASALVWAVLAGVAVYNVPSWGIGLVIGALVATAVVLLANLWFNPWNPLKAVQSRMVSKPGDAELELATEALRTLVRTAAK